MIEIVSIEEIIKDNSEMPPQIISDGILIDEGLLLITGEAKARKTFLAYNLAFGIAKGGDFAGFKFPVRKKVLFLVAEGGRHSNYARLKKISNSFDEGKLGELNFSFKNKLLFDNGSTDLKDLRDKIIEKKYEVVFFDPFVRYHTANENSAQEVAEVFRTIRELMNELNISVVLVHHTGKNAYQGARGSSVINGEYDSQITIKKEKNGLHTLEFDLRHAPSPEKRTILFKEDTFTFEIGNAGLKRNNQDPFFEILVEEPLTKNDLVKKALRIKRNTNNKSIGGKSTLYKKLNEYEECGKVKIDEEGRYRVV